MEFPGTRHEWPRRRAAEHRDEVAAFHGATPKAKDHGLSIAGLECQWCASQQTRAPHVRDGSFASVLCPVHVRFTPDSDRIADIVGREKCATFGLMQCSK
jgi:hypothetical protein